MGGARGPPRATRSRASASTASARAGSRRRPRHRAGDDDGDGCRGHLVGHADGALGRGGCRRDLDGDLLHRRGRVGHHVVRGLPELAEEPGQPERRQKEDRGQRRRRRDARRLRSTRRRKLFAERWISAFALLRRYAEGVADLLVERPRTHRFQRPAVVIGDGRQDRADLSWSGPTRPPWTESSVNETTSRLSSEMSDIPGRAGTARAARGPCRATRSWRCARPTPGALPAVEPAEAPIDTEHRLLDGLVGLLAILEDAVADLGRQGPVLHRRCRSRRRCTRLEREHQSLSSSRSDPTWGVSGHR